MKKFYFFLLAGLFSFTASAQCPIIINPSSTVTCVGQSVNMVAGSTATSYTWMPGGMTSQSVNVTPLSTTTYTVIGTDGICTDSASITITVNPLPSITATAFSPTICQGSCAGVQAYGGMTYTWSTGATGATDIVCPNTNTTYSVTGTDANGCVDSAIVNLIVNPSPIISITANPPTICSGGCTGLSGSGAQTYTWSTGFTGNPVNVCPTGTTGYTLTGEDANGCINTTTVVIGVSQTPTLAITAFPSNTICSGSNGVLSVTGATNYTWMPGGVTSNTMGITPFIASSYTVCGSNGMCISCDVAFIAVYTLTPYLSKIDAACGQNNGAITVDSVSGAIPPLTYSLNYVSQGSNTSYNNLSAGNYTFQATDSLGCYAYGGISVNNSNFSAQLNPTNPNCNLCNGNISSTIIGGSAPYTYIWNNGASTDSIGNLCAGSYQLSVTDSSGCFTSSTIGIASPLAPVIQFDSIVHVNCQGLTTGLARAQVSGGSPPYTYSWNTTPMQTTNMATGLTVGNYILTVTDNLGCQSSQNIYISTSNNIYTYVTSSSAANCGTTGSASIQAFGGSPPYTYNWSSGSTTANATGLIGGAAYTFTVTDLNGCAGYGSFTVPTMCMNLIKGRIYDDANQNCVQDVGEAGLAYRLLVAVPGPYYASSDANGDYTIATPNMTNTVTAYTGQGYYTPTCPVSGSLTVAFSQPGDTSLNNDFGYYTNPNYVDLMVSGGWGGGNPGMTRTYFIYYANLGPTPQNALVRMTYDTSLTYDSCTGGGVHFPGQYKIEWTLNNVQPSQWWYNNLRAYIKIPASTSLSTILHSCFEILPISGDADSTNNTHCTNEPVTGSYDPNEKGVWPNGNILQTDSVLFYTVHFQNTGTDTAYRVVVVDTLSQYLDPTTIVPGAASHKYTFDLSGQGICTWTFDSIMLPDSAANLAGSNGYFNFTIKLKPGNPIGTIINNTAGIYFDFNSPVITNTTINTIVNPVGVPENFMAGMNSELLLYPNPTNGNFTVLYELKEDSKVSLEVRNLLGELVRSVPTTTKQKGLQAEEINTHGLANGVYLVKLQSGNTQRTQKVIIQK